MADSFKTLVELQQLSSEKFATSDVFGTKLADGSWSWLTYGDFQKLIDRARGGLAALGVGAGDRVAIISDNRVEWAVLAFATYGLGASYVPMYQAQLPAEWGYIVGDCGAKVVFGATNAIVSSLREVTRDIPTLQHVLGLELPASDEASYAKLLERGDANPTPVARVVPSDLAAIIYTSGTTGNPKGVELTHDNFCSNVRAALERFDFGPGDRSLAFLPWAHVFGQMAELYSLLRKGATLAINDAVPNLITNLPVVRPTVLVAVPRIFNRIYDGVNKQMTEKPAIIQKLFHAAIAAATKRSRGESLGLGESLALKLGDKLIFSKVRMKFGGRLRFVVSGSAALSPAVGEFIDALGIAVYEGYGLTETSPVVSANYAGHRKIGSVGPAFPGVEIRIDRTVTGDPVHGEIVVSGPNVMRGYHNHPEETAQVILPDGSFRTGDMGYLDKDGFLYITGRIKEQYKLETGKYVVPSPLEEELKLSPFIINVMLHGVNKPHNVALVVPDLPALQNWAKEQGHTLGDITKDPKVRELLRGELEKYSATFKSYERPKNFAILTEDFTTENDMLTPKLSLKRRNVLARYGADLEALYR
jgi:long-chain acyl-CoA synthetase